MNPQQRLISRVGLLAAQLKQRQWRLTTAESCTGGGLAYALTECPGSSSWFEQGFITYSNLAKQRQLAVDPTVLAAQGAVSSAVVDAMAIGALHKAAADIAVAVSGIAGPGGGTVDKPVGTVWLAWATAGECTHRCCHFLGDRQSVRAQAVDKALSGLIERSA
ncbi:MAG: CinA family protein [Cellvibrionaceae bacterium]|nr:CinA family protein [Cellvibrionaceae bacterium]